MSKLLPKKYGDKITNVHQGEDGKPIQTETIVKFTLNTPKLPSQETSPPV